VLALPAGGRQAAAEEVEAEEDFQFDVEAFEKKPFEWGGFLGLRGTQLVADPDAGAPGSDGLDGSGRLVHQVSGEVDLEARLRKGPVVAHGQVRGTAETGEQGFGSRLSVFQLRLAAQPTPLLNLEVGKTVVRWGKGYAFSPIAFIDRPKDPGDPEEALEGFVLARAELTRGFDGPLETVSLTAAVVPVHEGVNEDFGLPGHENLAAKLYLLLLDTDLDLAALAGGSRGERFGMAVARNITSNVEVHAEAAWIPEVPAPPAATGEPTGTGRRDAVQALVGARYLSSLDTTFIAEYYHNGAGIAAGAPLEERSVPFPMRHYLYLRISQKEPFGVLDLFPSIIAVVNPRDGSFAATPEVLCKGITNLELRLRGTVLLGAAGTDFGERPSDGRFELRARYSF